MYDERNTVSRDNIAEIRGRLLGTFVFLLRRVETVRNSPFSERYSVTTVSARPIRPSTSGTVPVHVRPTGVSESGKRSSI